MMVPETLQWAVGIGQDPYPAGITVDAIGLASRRFLRLSCEWRRDREQGQDKGYYAHSVSSLPDYARCRFYYANQSLDEAVTITDIRGANTIEHPPLSHQDTRRSGRYLRH